ncbi:MAG: gephyrin-like molybdotransferase Glp [Pseudomonadota bacterium]
MISVDEALAECLALVAPLPSEEVHLLQAGGRVLVEPVLAARDQPPFAASAMDGYALASADARPGAQFSVVAEAPAGRAWTGRLGPGQALRIFTGAPVPEGADRVVIQEDVRREGDVITLNETLDTGPYIRPAGGDFRAGDRMDAPRRLGPADIALAASMGGAKLWVTRRPKVALLATGDELVPPGGRPREDQIVASNAYGLAAMVQAAGGVPQLLPIARDDRDTLRACLELARGADLIVTIGGASVGDHDLVGDVSAAMGLEQSFYKIAMRPGKPLMAGRLGAAALIGLPGNPVSALVCGQIFVCPMLRALQGLPAEAQAPLKACLAEPIGENGPRAHYMRAKLGRPLTGQSLPSITPVDSQDSALLSRLSRADALMIRAPDARAAPAGEIVDYLPLLT